MGRKRKNETDPNWEPSDQPFAAKITRSMLATLDALAKEEKRSRSQVGVLLMQRGLEAYQKDLLLVPPETVSVTVVTTASEKSKDEKTTARSASRQHRTR